ncbi:hypothetical protein [uncultured Devosia sp.]|uniref:hypothetical protein n=1 Tax=uncultured Devosia sp. TaxID=211434 RepID=UPI0035CC71C6
MDRRSFVCAAIAGLALPALVRPAFAETPSLRFRDLYSRGMELAPETAALDGAQIAMTGYMAPPLKPEVGFFVLTKLPMATCPFCNDAADWPTDLVVAYAADPIDVVRFSTLIRVEGQFETGFKTDADTGFVSFLRLMNVTYNRA